MIPRQKTERAFGHRSARKNRTRDHPNIAIGKLTASQFFNARTKPGSNQPGLVYSRACQRDNSPHIKLTSQEEMTDRHDVLVVDVPDLLVPINRVEKVNVSSNEASRVWTVELNVINISQFFAGKSDSGTTDEEHFSIGQVADDLDTESEVLLTLTDDDFRFRTKRVCVGRCNED